MTANPSWREIKDELKPHQTASDRPDLIARVFELKRKALMNEIVKKKLFGEVAAYVFTIEFQKRGLPHMHALIFLKQPHKINSFNPFAQCMEKGECSKRYPRVFVDFTSMDRDGYPQYRRRDIGIQYEVKGVMVDNRNAVPYNPHLSAMFDAHINVEEWPNVVRLALHLPGMHRVPYNTNETPEQVLERAANQQTTLNSFL
ncbi:hypothetical protein ACHQM5_030150 [Ranunculus cassubicifolius]